MKKLLWILLSGALVMACGDASDRSENRDAAKEEDADVGSGTVISPQVQLDSSDVRFGADTISSSLDAEEQTRGEDF